MAHRSSAESNDQIPSKNLKTPHPSKDIIINMEEEEEQQQQQDPLFSLTKVNHDGIHRDKQDPSASKSLLCEEEKMALQEAAKESSITEGLEEDDSGRERLKRHRVEVAGRVWIPDMWGQEDLLKDWIDCTAFDAPLLPSKISTAREALVQDCTRPNASGLRIDNRC